jgi:NAD(P)-dependent dehydrogenase (short-subunit alcohol dehydrogenase family)
MIIITGASRGIGKFLFEKYISEGKNVWGIYNSTAPNLESENLSKLDISDIETVLSWVQRHKDKLNDITLINCAGVNYNAFAHKASHQEWANVIKVNVIGTFNMISSLLPIMREQNYGRIINFGSVVADLPTPGISAYTASKAAIAGMSKSISVENATKNITINTINLGYSELGMISEVPEAFLAQIIEKIPSKNLCKPEDIFSSVEYLRSTPYVNGATLKVNGGMI